MRTIGSTPFYQTELPQGALPRGVTSAHSFRAEEETRASADLAFVTAEGDRVTLSASASSQTAYATYDAQGRLDGQRVDASATRFQFSALQHNALEVEGNLSRAELADIQQVLTAIGDVATDFFAGDLDAAFAEALDFGDIGSLASFEANLAYEQRLEVTQSLTSSGLTPEEAFQTPAAQPADLTSLLESLSAEAAERTQSFLDALVNDVQATHGDPRDIAGQEPAFLHKLSEKLAEQPALDPSRHQLAANIATELFQRLTTAPAQISG